MAAGGVKPGTSCKAKPGSIRLYPTIIHVAKDGSSASNIVVWLIRATLGPKRNMTTSFAVFVKHCLAKIVSGK